MSGAETLLKVVCQRVKHRSAAEHVLERWKRLKCSRSVKPRTASWSQSSQKCPISESLL